MKVKQIKIVFNVTPEIKRFVYVYLITTKTGCILVDSGVYGSQAVIEKAITESGHQPEKVKAVFLTHAHPDHIGTAHYFREKYGAKIYAGEAERPWIEDIDRQFRERPIPNFYKLAGKSTTVDCMVKDGEEISICEDILVQVIGTPGHSVDEISYRIGETVFIGDTVPVRGGYSDSGGFGRFQKISGNTGKSEKCPDILPGLGSDIFRRNNEAKNKGCRRVAGEIKKKQYVIWMMVENCQN